MEIGISEGVNLKEKIVNELERIRYQIDPFAYAANGGRIIPKSLSHTAFCWA